MSDGIILDLVLSSEWKDKFNLNEWVSLWKTPEQIEYIESNRADPNGNFLFHPENQTTEKVFFLRPATEEESSKLTKEIDERPLLD